MNFAPRSFFPSSLFTSPSRRGSSFLHAATIADVKNWPTTAAVRFTELKTLSIKL